MYVLWVRFVCVCVNNTICLSVMTKAKLRFLNRPAIHHYHSQTCHCWHVQKQHIQAQLSVSVLGGCAPPSRASSPYSANTVLATLQVDRSLESSSCCQKEQGVSDDMGE